MHFLNYQLVWSIKFAFNFDSENVTDVLLVYFLILLNNLITTIQ